jgi:phosphopantetheinyl transferase (holo-ACP synthase)
MSQKILNYLGNLTNKPVTDEQEIYLSSAQRARFHAWLIDNKITFNESLLSGKFILNDLLMGDSISDAQASQLLPSSPTSSAVNLGGIGIDYQKVDELFPLGIPDDPKSDSELLKIFTVTELSYAQSKSNPAETLTGIFCAKEAILKCSSCFMDLTNINVTYDASGRPSVTGYEVSISHSGGYAVAIALVDSRLEDQANFPAQINFYTSKDAISSERARGSLRLLDWFFILFIALGFLIPLIR